MANKKEKEKQQLIGSIVKTPPISNRIAQNFALDHELQRGDVRLGQPARLDGENRGGRPVHEENLFFILRKPWFVVNAKSG